MATATATMLRACGLLARDTMTRELAVVPRMASLREAARRLCEAGASDAPVVDEHGRCLGLLSAADIVRWAAEGRPDSAAGPERACQYQQSGRLLDGQEAVLCTLAGGACPLQADRPAPDGGRVSVCLMPTGLVNDWQQPVDLAARDPACLFMTTSFPSATPTTPLEEVARMMADSGLPRLYVLDESRRPVGAVSCIDVLAALTAE